MSAPLFTPEESRCDCGCDLTSVKEMNMGRCDGCVSLMETNETMIELYGLSLGEMGE